MDLRRLRFFLAVADHGGFTRAAETVFVSQPALSLAIKELETELGAQLFYRLGRQVTLTPAGAALEGPARQALRDLETARAAVSSVVDLGGGTLDVCCLPTLAADPMARILGRFSQAHPDVLIELAAPDDPADLARLLRNGQSEVGLTEAAMAAELEHEDLVDQTLLVVLPPGTRHNRQRFNLDRLGDVAWITTPKGTSSRRLFDEAFASAGIQPRITVVTAQREAMLPLVLSGAGAALLPEPIAQTASRLKAVVRRPHPAIHRRVVLSRRRGPLAPAAAAFVDLARSVERRRSGNN
jgi:LysR family transcriptional regulator, carnitine catabolism transcriptional activator